jgi:hypothetical protein
MVSSSAPVPDVAAARIARFLAMTDARLGGLVEAVWVEGSIALGDFHAKHSDIDLVLLTRREVDDRERVAIRGRPAVQATWLTRERAATLAACDGGTGAVLAATLHRHGIAIRGPHPAEIVCDVDRATLSRAVLANLEAYWVPWLERARRHPLQRLATLHPRLIFWGVAGVPRQYVTIGEGRIVSKCAAVRVARERFDPRWHRILDEALRLRLGGARSAYASPFERRRDMIAFVEHAIEVTRRSCCASYSIQ